MSGLWRNDPETPEGKYPIVLRRDGTPLKTRFIVLALRDPCAQAALEAYAYKADELNMDAQFVSVSTARARSLLFLFHLKMLT